MDLTRVGAIALHTLAMMIVLGYYGVLGRIVLPALRRTLEPRQLGLSLVAVERRARPLLIISVALFAITGIYLMIVDEQYAGLGNIGGSTWAALVLGKHVVVAALVGVGLVVDRLIDGLADRDEGPPAGSVRLVGLATETATLLGVVVIVMTAAAQLATS